ncbi:MAG: hypothetical protein Q6358_13365 [Candidatus Brocadiales bacterium]|nr:hypothetical protein [Candidatus Brocadiales bacterium]
MPQDIVFDNLPAGYSENSARSGEKITIRLMDFVSSEDGDELITKLEELPQQILSMLHLPPPGVLPSMVHSLLVIIRKDKTATVYLNELQPVWQMRVKGSCKKGELVTSNHILDVGRMKFPDITIPPEAGVAYVFSVGWRKGFFYDLSPLHDDQGRCRSYDLEETIGSLYAYLLFQERFKIDDATWKVFFDQRWFPFTHLNNALIREMISHARQGWQIDDLLPKIVQNVKELLRADPLEAKKVTAFTDHLDILRTAVDRYLADDHVSAASILYPRIEGLLRSFLRAAGYTVTPTTKTLSKVAVEHHEANRITNSLLLPAKFHQYLDDVYFAHFTPGSSPDVGRHSVAHGEARMADFTLKATTLAFLLVYQLRLFFSDGKKT